MKGISKKLILILLSCTLVVVALLGVLEYHAGQLLIDRQVEKTLQTIGERLSLSLRQSLYELDRVTTHDTILSEFPSKELQSIIVWDQGRHHVIAGFERRLDGSLADVEALPSDPDLLLSHRNWPVVVSSIRSPGGILNVGEIDVFVNRAPLVSTLQKQVKLNLLKVVLTVGLILIVLSKIINHYLVGPLENIQKAMQETKRFYLEDKSEGYDVAQMTDLFSANWTEDAFQELKQMDQALREMLVAAYDRQEALRSSETYFRTLIQTSPDAITVTRIADGSFVDVNDMVAEMFGYSRDDIAGKESTVSLNLWVEPAARESFFRHLKKEGKIDNLEANFRSRDGRILTTLVSARPIQYRDEPCLLTFVKDISEIKQANMALQESEVKFRKLSQEFETVLDGIFESLLLFDTKKNVVWGNRSAMNQFEISQETLVGMNCQQLWGEGEKTFSETCIEEVFSSGNATESICVDARDRTWGIKAYPVFGNEGNVVNVIQVATDLSEKLQLREDAARTAHLASLGELSAGVAHEINNPTGLILMTVPFVKDVMRDLLPLMDDYVAEHPGLMVADLPYDSFRQEIMQTIEDIHGGAQRIKRIVDDLKDFAAEKPSHDELVDLADVTEKSLRLLHNVIKNSTDHFVLELEDNLPNVKGIWQRLEQVLVNLIHNACQSLTSREQSVTLRIRSSKEGRRVVLEVTDEGRGIATETIDKVTDPFFTTRRAEGGTGLGLSVSTRIIDEHNGVLKVTSEVGKGSTFAIILPSANGAPL